MKSTPVVLKEFLCDYNWVLNHRKMCEDKFLLDQKLGIEQWDVGIFDKYLKKHQRLYYEIIKNFETNWQQLIEKADEINFPKSIFSLIQQYENQNDNTQIQKKINYNLLQSQYQSIIIQIGSDDSLTVKEKQKLYNIVQKYKNKEGISNEEMNKLKDFIQLVKNNEDQNITDKLQTYSKQSSLDIFNICYKSLNSLFLDPREEEEEKKKNINDPSDSKFLIYRYIRNKYFMGDSSVMYHLGVLSSISELRKSHENFSTKKQNNEQQIKTVVSQIDFILSQIEKYNIYHPITDFFSKLRVFPYIGLATGYAIDHDQLIVGNVTSQFTPNTKAKEIKEIYDKFGFNQSKSKLYYPQLQYKIKWNQEHVFQDLDPNNRKENQKYFKIYEMNQIIRQLHSKVQDNLLDNPENYYQPNFFDDMVIKQENYAYDISDPFEFQEYVIPNNVAINRIKYLQNEEGEWKQDNLSGKSLQLIYQDQEEYYNMVCQDKFQILIDTVRENYHTLLFNKFLSEKYSKLNLSVCQGLLFLNAAAYQNNQNTDQEELQNYVSSVSMNIKSDKKDSKQQLSNILMAYINDQSQLLDLLNYSTICYPNNNIDTSILSPQKYPGHLLSQIVWGFDLCHIHSYQQINWKTFDILQRTSISQNEASNQQQCLRILWECAVSISKIHRIEELNLNNQKQQISQNITEIIFPQQLDLSQSTTTDILFMDSFEQSEYFEKLKRIQYTYSKIALCIQGDFSFVFENTEEQQKLANYFFEDVFRLESKEEYDLIQCLCALKPEKQNPETIEYLRYNIDTFIEKIIQNKFFIFQNKIELIYSNRVNMNDSDINILQENDFDDEIVKETKEAKHEKDKQQAQKKKIAQDLEMKAEKLFMKLVLGFQLRYLPKIIEVFKELQSTQLWGYQLQSLFFWKKLATLGFPDNDISDINDVTRINLHFWSEYIFYLITKSYTNKEYKSSLYSVSIESFKQDYDENNKNTNGTTSLEQGKSFIGSSGNFFYPHCKYDLTDQVYKRISEMKSSFNSNVAWICWNLALDKIKSNQQALYEEHDRQITLFNVISGQIFSQIKSISIQEYLYQLYFHGSKILYTPQSLIIKEEGREEETNILQKLPQLVPCLKTFKQFAIRKEPKMKVFELFINMLVMIQKNNENQRQRDPKVVIAILHSVQQAILLLDIQEDLQQENEAKQIIASLLSFFTNYDLKSVDPNNIKNLKMNHMDYEQKVKNFNIFAQKLIFHNERLEQIFNMSNIRRIYISLHTLSEIQNKSMSDSDFFEESLNFCKAMASLQADLTNESNFKYSQDTFNQISSFSENPEFIQINKNQNSLFPNQISMSHQGMPLSDIKSIFELSIGKIEGTFEDLFKLTDQDDSGFISKDEFMTIITRMGMTLSPHRVNEIFANIKKKSLNQAFEKELDFEEFQQALDYLQNKNVDMTMEKLGLSLQQIVQAVAVITLIMLLIIFFIFVGISAFSIGGSFGAVINSIIPVTGGIFISKSQSEDTSELDEDRLKDYVKGSRDIIQTQTI